VTPLELGTHPKPPQIADALVYVGGKKIKIARANMSMDTKFKVEKQEKYKILFEDENIFVIYKPPFITSENLQKKIKFQLLHRLDKETSGILMFVKNDDFRQKAIEEFKHNRVYKEYVALVSGILYEEIKIDQPLTTFKSKIAKTKIDLHGKPALTKVTPLEVINKISKVKVVIENGRTHQIRVHLSSVNFPVIGDELYGTKSAKRVMLHAKRVKLFDYEFIAKEPSEFINYENI
jgi:23S rRNA pseudouridine1911/1915/1917 synthase